MIEKIYKSLTPDVYANQSVIEAVLTKAEEFGMWPPRNHNQYDDGNCGMLPVDCDSVYCCVWDDEDEVKENE